MITKHIFSPCQNWIDHKLWEHSGKPFSKDPQYYKYKLGAITYLRNESEKIIYPPILSFVQDNCKKFHLPSTIITKDKKIPSFGSLLLNYEFITKLIVVDQLGLSRREILKLIDIGPFKGIFSLKTVEKFYFYFWNIRPEDRKLADQAIMKMQKPKSNIIRLYSLQLQGEISVETLLGFITGKLSLSSLKNKIINFAAYSVDRLQTYNKGYDPDDAGQQINQMLTLTKIVKNANEFPND